jgi:antitoxin CptB
MEQEAIRRKRLLYLARHRGTQESDLVIGGFAEKYLAQFNTGELDQFEALINENDADLMDWISDRVKAPDDLNGTVLTLLVKYKNSLIRN